MTSLNDNTKLFLELAQKKRTFLQAQKKTFVPTGTTKKIVPFAWKFRHKKKLYLLTGTKKRTFWNHINHMKKHNVLTTKVTQKKRAFAWQKMAQKKRAFCKAKNGTKKNVRSKNMVIFGKMAIKTRGLVEVFLFHTNMISNCLRLLHCKGLSTDPQYAA